MTDLLTMARRGTATIVVLALAACFGATLLRSPAGPQSPTPRPQVGQTPPAQDPIDQRQPRQLTAVRAAADTGERAMAHVRRITGFGARHSGQTPTPGWSLQLDYIATELLRLGLQPERDTWTDRRELITFTNIRATIPGRRPERILLGCHHDTKCTQGHAEPAHNFAFVGANDGASAVALLLAMVPELQRGPREATLELVFFDGEESLDWGWNGSARALFGSRRYVREHRDAAAVRGDAPRIEAIVLLDMVGRTDLHIQEELYSTKALREIAFGAAVATGHRDKFFRQAEAASDDHVPFLDVGIPAVDLIDLVGNPHWHKPTDTIDNLSPASMQAIADVVLTMLPAIEREYFAAGR